MLPPKIPIAPDAPPDGEAIQRVVKIRRDYNNWVVRETIEDYALRYTARSARKWSARRVANTAFGATSFLVLEALGATLLVNYGFVNAFWAILATGLIIFLLGLPISVYAARYGVDMDLLTRGAGFGYIGSTFTSLIYASFTFFFFALEAAVMAYALELGFHIPPAWGYLLGAVVVIPLVTHGVTTISLVQTVTQPLWLLLLALPYLFLLGAEPDMLNQLWGHGPGFDIHLFGAALSVGIALVAQMGEQADYLRFMPEIARTGRLSWWTCVLVGGPGWVLLGSAKMLGGALLAWLLLQHGMSALQAVDPNQMYLIGFSRVFANPHLALWVTVLFVIICQVKINITNAYAGSIAWSNFFSRLTHSHPGRVVWMVFNTVIALMLMEMDVFHALGRALGLYSNIAVSWMAAVVADLVINKPLGLSPPGIEFKRAHLYDINPVGVGAMLLASALSISAYLGLFGADVTPYASIIALGAAMSLAPLIAWATGGRYYMARPPSAAAPGLATCCICARPYEADDVAHCPAYQGPICSLCCSLDARCNDLCKPHGRISTQWTALLARLLPPRMQKLVNTGLAHYLLLMAVLVPGLCLLLGLMYYQEVLSLAAHEAYLQPHLREVFLKVFAALLLVLGIVAWWLVLTHRSQRVAQEESNRQTSLLIREIDLHKATDDALQRAKHSAELANQAKSRYITTISHELRTPLNSILGYAQILDGDPTVPEHRRQAISVIRKSGDHLLSLIEGTLDIARIEGGKLTLDVRPLAFPEFVQQLVDMFQLQARNKGLYFDYRAEGELPAQVRADERRLRQILINILGNAVKFTRRGGVILRLKYQREMATFEIEDSGPGLAPAELERIFEPFAQGEQAAAGGSGLGLTISKMLTDVMGGELLVDSRLGHGSRFRIRLFLPQVPLTARRATPIKLRPLGYTGQRRRILVVDNERVDRELLVNLLAPLGFMMEQAASGDEALEMIARFNPDLIFMDLAMPGIDGWETLRRIRSRGLSQAPVAIISANAFEKGLEQSSQESGIPAADFLLKPVRINELFDWIERQTGLCWISAPPPVASEIMLPPATPLPPALAQELESLIDLGYIRGILNKLGEIEASRPETLALCQLLREQARNFQFDAMKHLLRPQIP